MNEGSDQLQQGGGAQRSGKSMNVGSPGGMGGGNAKRRFRSAGEGSASILDRSVLNKYLYVVSRPHRERNKHIGPIQRRGGGVVGGQLTVLQYVVALRNIWVEPGKPRNGT